MVKRVAQTVSFSQTFISIIDHHNILGIHPFIQEKKEKKIAQSAINRGQVLYINVTRVLFVMHYLLCTK